MIWSRSDRGSARSLRQVPVGIVIGIMGMILMLASWKLQPGIVFDTRSILLGVSGLFFGTVPTVIAMIVTAAFRFSMGGPAAGMGIAVIVASGAIGIAWRSKRRQFLADITWRDLFLFGFLIHLAMLACTIFLPGTTRWHVLANIVLPVLLIYPAVTAILGRLLADHLKRARMNQKLRESEERYQNLGQNLSGRDLPHRPWRRHHVRESHVVPNIRPVRGRRHG